MRLDDAKLKFVDTWGRLGSEWGINRTMAQIHALLLVTDEACDTNEVMESLKISRGNANMNLRELLDWGLIDKELVPGERKEYFRATKDPWAIARNIAEQRYRRELAPLMKSLEELEAANISDSGKSTEVKEFKKLVRGFVDLGSDARALLELVARVDRLKFFQPFKRLLSRPGKRN